MSDIIRLLSDDDPNDREAWAGTAEVIDDDAGATPDGRLLITVRWRGGDYDCAYLASYTPVVGRWVSFIKDGPILLVLGEPATT